MQKIIAIAAIAAISLIAPQIAVAQTSSQGQTHGSIREQVKNSLEQAGFTNIRIMPESFLVRATDQNGNPVMMVINPDSMTAITSMSSDQGNANSEEREGQTTSKSAKMTDKPENSTSPAEANQTTSKSSKMNGGPSSND